MDTENVTFKINSDICCNEMEHETIVVNNDSIDNAATDKPVNTLKRLRTCRKDTTALTGKIMFQITFN